MSLLWIDGFEGYGTTGAPSPANVLARRYPTIASESSMDIEAGRIAGYSIQLDTTACAFSTPAINADATIILGFAMKLVTIPATAQRIVSLFDGATEGINLRINNSGELSILLQSTQLEITSGLGLTTGAWYWIEIKVVVDNSTGSYDVKVGSATVLSDTGLDTQVGGNAYYDIVRFKGGDTTATQMFIDDLYICNGAGSVNNDFLGNVQVIALFPDADGNYTDFTPSAGDNYACVDEAIVDDDTTYVESSTDGHTDTYSYTSLDDYAIIKGLQINSTVRETDATSYDLIPIIRSNSTDYPESPQAIGSTNYVDRRTIAELDPDTAAAWLYTGINAAEFGYKVDVP